MIFLNLHATQRQRRHAVETELARELRASLPSQVYVEWLRDELAQLDGGGSFTPALPDPDPGVDVDAIFGEIEEGALG